MATLIPDKFNYTAYGHTFKNERDFNAYKSMKSEARSRALARKKSMTSQEKSDAETRNHFAKEAKHFNIK